MSNVKNGAVEITILTLKKGYSIKDFIEVNKEIDPWLQKQKGFRSRTIFEQANGKIYDLLIWDKESDGEKSMRLLMKEFANSPIHEMIDQRTVNWFVSPIAHSLINLN